MSTGPQKYPGASTAYWYQDTYGGDFQEVNVIVLHTTEGRSLPNYDGGAVAPNITAMPDFAAKRLRWYQHFDFDRSSRALVNLRGGVETNTNNVAQVEMVGTCDPVTHAKWTAAGYVHIYWPEAPDWALQGVAEFLAWAHANHDVPLSGPKVWKAYPASYGTYNGVRMNDTQWNAFKGVCGHQHVDENLHGDPGALDFARILQLATGTTTPAPPTPSEETDMTIQKIDEANAFDVDLADNVWTTLAFTDAVIHSGPRQLVGPTYVQLTFDPAAVGLVTGRFILTNPDGTSPSGYGDIGEFPAGAVPQFHHNHDIPASKTLRFQVKARTGDGSTTKLIHRVVSGDFAV
jgi:hypothetical protein